MNGETDTVVYVCVVFFLFFNAAINVQHCFFFCYAMHCLVIIVSTLSCCLVNMFWESTSN